LTLDPRLSTALADRYRLERELGQGGMATVYLAHDLKHERQVAIKVLRPELAAVIGAERFLREIKTIANLQHPHVLPLFDSGQVMVEGLGSKVEGQSRETLDPGPWTAVYYVMPFVEGESLRDRLTREKQLPIADAVRLATEVASALDYAHRHGVIHRDIKPENILLHDGQALVADFGIALAVSQAGGTRMTETGMSLGTPHYMSPEQAMGEREITARSDVYALGAVTYEMLTGDPPFTGSTAQAIVARVVTETPRPMLPQRSTIPPGVEDAVLTALQKLPADRFGSAAEFAAALAGDGQAGRRTVGPQQNNLLSARPPVRPTVLLGLLAATAILAAWGWVRAARAGAGGTTWSYVTFGDSARIQLTSAALAISPDGSTIVFKNGVQDGRLWAKRRGELNPTSIPGTERASSPTFSPDGQWIAFVADQQLKKVRPAGGAVVTLADSVWSGGAAWLDDATLIYEDAVFNEFRRVSAAGGVHTVALRDSTTFGTSASGFTPLPGARGILYTSCTAGCASMALRVLDLKQGTQRKLFDDVGQGWYLPEGQLLYVRRDGAALVAPFSLRSLEPSGSAVPVLENVQVGGGWAQLGVSRTGSLVYVQGSGLSTDQLVVRVTHDGLATPLDSGWIGQFNSLALSPDGRRLAAGVGGSNGQLNIWVRSLDRGPATRLTFGGQERRPAWSPDGRQVAFVRDTANTTVVDVRPADGTGTEHRLTRLDRMVQEVAWSPDGRWLILRTDNGAAGAGDIVGVRLAGDTTPVPLVASPFTELCPALSPDGRWLAYSSNESGRNEIYVRPFPATDGGRWQVSSGGGAEPRWSPDGREIFFLEPGASMMVAEVVTTPSFAVGESHRLFSTAGVIDLGFHQSYDVTADGRAFLMVFPRHSGARDRAPTVVQAENWFADVRSRLRQ
jgi:serine/threonine-protein kinase